MNVEISTYVHGCYNTSRSYAIASFRFNYLSSTPLFGKLVQKGKKKVQQ